MQNRSSQLGNYVNTTFKRLPKPKTLNDINSDPVLPRVNFEENVVFLKQSMKEKDGEILKLLHQLRVSQSDVSKYKHENDELKQDNAILRNEVQLYRERKSIDTENHMKISELQSSERECKRLLNEEREINRRNGEKILKQKTQIQTITFQTLRQRQFTKELKQKVRKQKERKAELKMRIKQYIEGNMNQFREVQTAVKKMKEVNHTPDEMNKLYNLIQKQQAYMKKMRAKYRKVKKEKQEKIEDLKESKRECIELIKNHDHEFEAYVKRISTLERMLEKTRIKLQKLNKSIHVSKPNKKNGKFKKV